MVQYSQTSWQEYTLANMLETMRYAPMNVTIGKSPVVHYMLPKAIEAGEIVRYTVVVPFRGFNASHEFVDEGNLTACYDDFSFQGFSEFPEEAFAKVMDNASVVYAVASRKDARDTLAAIESKECFNGLCLRLVQVTLIGTVAHLDDS